MSPEAPCGPALPEPGLDWPLTGIPSQFVGELFCEQPDDQNFDQEELIIPTEQAKCWQGGVVAVNYKPPPE